MALPLGAASLRLAGLVVAGLVLPVLVLPVLSLLRPAVAQKITPLHRRRPFTVGAPSPSHQSSAPTPQTPQQTPQPPLKAAYIGKRPHSSSKKPPHRMGQHQIDIDKRSWPIRKAKLPVGVTVLWPSLFRAGRHARNQTGILDRSGGKPAGLRLMSALHIHAKNNAR